MNLPEHIKYIRERCIDAIAAGDEMSVASFETGEGLVMTFNEAIEIVNEIDRLKAERDKLLNALKNILPYSTENPIKHPGQEYAERIVKFVIEKLETT